MKKVAIIGTAGVPARYGGFETLVHQLVTHLNRSFKLSIYCSNKYYPKEERKKYWNNARLHHLPFNANGGQSIIYDIISIIHALFYADVLLILGVSGGILIPFVKLFTRKKIIVNIDGLEWKRDKWSSPIKRFLRFSEYLAVKYSDADISDNESIRNYTAKHYKTLSLLVEYGADHASKQEITEEHKEKYPFLKEKYAFKVSRIEPENNNHLILEAFSKLPQKTLVMLGNWDRSEYGIELKEKYSKFPNIKILNPIYEQKELDILRSNCDIYVHGHSAGGTNPSLVEAMYLGLPIVTYGVSYNKATTENKAFYFSDEKELINILESKIENDYLENRKIMKEIADRRYTWEIIAQKYANLIYGFDYNYSKKKVDSKTSKLDNEHLTKEGMAHLKKPKKFYE